MGSSPELHHAFTAALLNISITLGIEVDSSGLTLLNLMSIQWENLTQYDPLFNPQLTLNN